jgi:hypothetical protein
MEQVVPQASQQHWMETAGACSWAQAQFYERIAQK